VQLRNEAKTSEMLGKPPRSSKDDGESEDEEDDVDDDENEIANNEELEEEGEPDDVDEDQAEDDEIQEHQFNEKLNNAKTRKHSFLEAFFPAAIKIDEVLLIQLRLYAVN
jgi:hypothetical protein